MTHFGNAIARILLNHPRGHAQRIADKIGMSRSTISKLQNGPIMHLSPKRLKKLVDALSENEYERAELIAAHMKDESCGYVPGMIEVRIKSGKQSGNGKNE
jgi:transcriptional regulator with XRE-family HTH domain